jgi:chromate transporter
MATEANAAGPPTPPEESHGAIFIRFLKFGCLAWGGSAAQIALIKRECVDEEM